MDYKKVVNLLKDKGQSIATMESCTGGAVVNAITSVEGSSEVLEFSAVTYSNLFKVKMGVSREIIEKFSVYSEETAKEMARAICEFAGSTYGVGITGKLNRVDKNNLYGKDNVVYISIYNSVNGEFKNKMVEVTRETRDLNKQVIVDIVLEMIIDIIR